LRKDLAAQKETSAVGELQGLEFLDAMGWNRAGAGKVFIFAVLFAYMIIIVEYCNTNPLNYVKLG